MLYVETVRRIKSIAKKIIRELHITGPFNIQFLAKSNDIKVIECNLRASRSFPFVSKTTKYNFIDIATRAIL
jgi:carbamoyl-phosphate synthase large subunit